MSDASSLLIIINGGSNELEKKNSDPGLLVAEMDLPELKCLWVVMELSGLKY